MTFAPLLIAFSLAAGALGTAELWEEKLLPARAALADELPEIAVARIEALIASAEFQASDEASQNSVRLLLGEALVRDSQLEKAVTTLSPISSDSATRNYWLGLAEAKLGNSQTALTTLAKVPAVDPVLGSLAQYNRLEILTRMDDTEGALTLLGSLRADNPEFRPQELALTEVALDLRKNDPDHAKVALSRLEPKDPRALALAGRIELIAGNHDEALEFFQKCLAANPSQPVQILALLGQADALLAKGEVVASLENLLKILAQSSDSETQELLFPRFDSLNLAARDSELQQRIRRELASFHDSPERADLNNEATRFVRFQEGRLLAPPKSLRHLEKLLEQFPTVRESDTLLAHTHLLLAKLLLKEGRIDRAKEELGQILQLPSGGPLTAATSDLLARLTANEGRWAEAEKLFAQAAQTSHSDFAETALINQAIIALRSTGSGDLSAISAKLSSPDSQSLLAFEQILAASLDDESGAGTALREFLSKNPRHPRRAEAGLALASSLLKANRPEAAEIAGVIEAIPGGLSVAQSHERFVLSHQLGVVTNQWDLAVRFGERHLKRHPTAESDPYFLLRLGESRFRNGDFDRARLLFSEVAESGKASGLEDVALYYTARANLAIPTATATTDALNTLDDLIARSGPLSTDARILKARTLLENLGKPRECLADLRLLPGKLADQPEVALLAAEAYRELGTSDPTQYEEALKTYRSLLADSRTSYARSNQLHYLIARTYRESGRPSLALEPLLDVIDFENRHSPDAPPEWDFYYQCGFEAIDLLLEAGRYRAALIQANKLAKTNGPGAAQAKERAEQIQLDHTLFTD